MPTELGLREGGTGTALCHQQRDLTGSRKSLTLLPQELLWETLSLEQSGGGGDLERGQALYQTNASQHQRQHQQLSANKSTRQLQTKDNEGVFAGLHNERSSTLQWRPYQKVRPQEEVGEFLRRGAGRGLAQKSDLVDQLDVSRRHGFHHPDTFLESVLDLWGERKRWRLI